MAPVAPPGASRTLVTLIDGDCALCSAYARVVSSLDRAGVVYFETQQSDVGRAVLRRARMPEDLSTIVVVEAASGDVRGYVKSTAVLRTFAALGAPGLPARDAKETLQGMCTWHTVAGLIAGFRQFKGSSSPVVGSVLMAGLAYWAQKE